MNLHSEQSGLLELTKELIKIPSTNSRPEKIHECDQLIQSWLAVRNIRYQTLLYNNVPSILVLPKEKYTPVLLMSHFDVVESENENLFIPKEKNGSLYGRGAIDDKYGVALSLMLFDQHLNRLSRRGRGQDAIITGDEEVGGANGTAKAIDHFTTDFFITIDGGSPDLVVTKEKGIILLELHASGHAAHAARPWLGQNAFDQLVGDYNRIRELFQDDTQDRWHKTLSLTNCSAGNGATNIVPRSASAVLDIRYTEHDDPDEIISSIKSVAGSKIVVKAKEPVFSSGKSPYLDKLIATSSALKTGCEHGASDARYLSGKGIPGAIWGADGEMSQHTEDEHIVLSSFFDMYKRLDGFVSSLPY